MKKVIVPNENKEEVEEIIKEIDIKDLTLFFASVMDEVLEEAFVANPLTTAKASKAKEDKKKSKKASKKK